MRYFLNFDGASTGRKEKAEARWAWILRKEAAGPVIASNNGKPPEEYPPTNNTAEYWALVEALRWARSVAIDRLGITSLIVLGDSKLIIDGTNHRWKFPNSPHLLAMQSIVLYELNLLRARVYVEVKWNRREFNSEADRMTRKKFKVPTNRGEDCFHGTETERHAAGDRGREEGRAEAARGDPQAGQAGTGGREGGAPGRLAAARGDHNPPVQASEQGAGVADAALSTMQQSEPVGQEATVPGQGRGQTGRGEGERPGLGPVAQRQRVPVPVRRDDSDLGGDADSSGGRVEPERGDLFGTVEQRGAETSRYAGSSVPGEVGRLTTKELVERIREQADGWGRTVTGWLMIPQAFKELAPQIVERLEYLQRRVDTFDEENPRDIA